MKRTKTVTAPCVITWGGKHVIHGTHGRAVRNALMTGYEYHVHEWVVPTVWGRLCSLFRRCFR